jgi:hypothetical protein
MPRHPLYRKHNMEGTVMIFLTTAKRVMDAKKTEHRRLNSTIQ